MSALAKPMIHSSRSTGDNQPLNAEKIVSFVKVVTPPIANSSTTEFQINFSMEAGTGPGNISWKYADQADLDADFTAILGLVSAVTP